jgi:hypothetical protein
MDTGSTVSDGNYALTIAKGTATVKVEKKVSETFNDAQETDGQGGQLPSRQRQARS